MIRARFFSALIVILAIVAIAANSFWLLPSIEAINRGISDLHLEIARRARAVLEGSLDETKDALNESAGLIGQNTRDAGNVVARLLNNNPSLGEISFVDIGGMEKAKVSRTKFIDEGMLRSRKGEAAFEDMVFAGKEEYSGPVFFSLLAEPLMDVSVPVRDPSGRLVGVLIAENNLRFIWDLMSQMNVGEGGRVYVVDRNKNLIADPNPSMVLRGENLSYRSIVNKVVGGAAID